MRNSLVICTCLMIATGCNPLPKVYEYMGWEDDNVLEEVAEYAIEWQTDIDVDLTPESPEDAD